MFLKGKFLSKLPWWQLSSTVYYAVQGDVIRTFGSVGEVVKYDHSKENYSATFSCDVVYYAEQTKWF